MKYEVVFEYVNVSDDMKDLMREEFFGIYNIACEYFNGMVNSINDAWDLEEPNADLVNDEAANERYNKFIASKVQPMAMIINQCNPNGLIDVWYDYEAQLRGRLKNDPMATIRFYLKRVES